MNDLKSFCLICFGKRDDLIDFNQQMIKDKSVFECFQSLTCLTISELCKVESRLCKNCFGKLKRAFEFKELCFQSYTIYKDEFLKDEGSQYI
jgi:hypothetical protein